jgi:hypothetical protein
MPGVLDLLKHLGCRQAANPWRRTCRFRGCLLLRARPSVLAPRARPALRLTHGLQHATHV